MKRGAWSMEHGAWSMERGAWSVEHWVLSKAVKYSCHTLSQYCPATLVSNVKKNYHHQY